MPDKVVNKIAEGVKPVGVDGNDPIMKDKGTPQQGVTEKAPIPRIGVKGLGKEQLSPEARSSFSAKRSSGGNGVE